MHILSEMGEITESAFRADREHGDRALPWIAREQRRAARPLQPAARVVEPLADVEHRLLHVGAPREMDRRRRFVVATDRTQLDDARRGLYGLLDRLSNE